MSIGAWIIGLALGGSVSLNVGLWRHVRYLNGVLWHYDRRMARIMERSEQR